MIHVIKQKWCYDYGKVKLLFIPLIKYFSILKKNVLIKEAVLYQILNLDSTLSTMKYRASIVITDIPRPKLISERHTEANPETARIENNAKKYLFWLKVRWLKERDTYLFSDLDNIFLKCPLVRSCIPNHLDIHRPTNRRLHTMRSGSK